MPSSETRETVLFSQAIGMPPAGRSAFLDAACGADPLLRQRLAALVAAHEQQDSLLDVIANAARVPGTVELDSNQPSLEEAIGDTIGRYKLLEKVGEGGCGVVYVAEQTEPVRRRIALKIIKLGMDTKAVVARFEAERQALAIMDHPNIARVLDAGATERGRPYFVMELVRGIGITDYCDRNRLSARERLDLFIKVCQAIQHAHQKGIIHRDVKPSNILVTLHDGVPVPKVIDFGIAKATEGRLTGVTVYTQLHQFIGTPAYMSPEQAELSGLDIDTRSDIYSLGVLLYELLTGRTPYDPRELLAAGLDQMRRTIRETDPVRPSTRLATLAGNELATTAGHRASEASKLISLVRGDLDWIVMKCLEKDRTRRYETANGLAADLRRHLNHEPVTAVRPSSMYRARKFLRRNKTSAAVLSAFVLVLVAASAISTWQAIRATAAVQNEMNARKDAESAGRQANDAALRAESALTASQFSEAQLAFDKGQLLGEQGDANLALLWLARSLELAPKDAQELRRAIRIGLDGWSRAITPLRWILPHEGRLYGVAFASDSRVVHSLGFLGNDGFVLQSSNTESGLPVGKPLRRLEGRVLCGVFSPDARQLAVGYANGALELVDVLSRRVSRIVPTETGRSISALAFSADGTLLAVADSTVAGPITDQTDENSGVFRGPSRVQLLVLESGTPRLKEPLLHEKAVWALAFHPSGSVFAASEAEWADHHDTGRIRFWDTSGQPVRAPLTCRIPALCMEFSADGSSLLSGHWDAHAYLWRVASDWSVDLEGTFPCDGPVGSVAFSPQDPTTIVTGSYGGTTRIWDTLGRRPLSPPLWHHSLPLGCTVSSDGAWMATGIDGELRLYSIPPTPSVSGATSYRPEQFPLAVGPDGAVLVHDADGFVRLRDSQSSETYGLPLPHDRPLVAADFSRDQRYAATVGEDRRAFLWDMTDPSAPRFLDHEEAAWSVAFSPDGTILATGHFGQVMLLWDVKTAQRVGRMEHSMHTGPIFVIRFSSDGRRILTGGADSQARLWELETHRQIGSFQHYTAVLAAAFSPDDELVVTAGPDHAARLWKVADGQPAGPPLQHQQPVIAVAFSPDGRSLLTGSMDRTARLWDVATGKQLGPPLRHSLSVGYVGFWDQGATLMTTEGRTAVDVAGPISATRYWKCPVALSGTDPQLQLWVQVVTGLELEASGGRRVLEWSEWDERRQALDVRNPEVPEHPPPR